MGSSFVNKQDLDKHVQCYLSTSLSFVDIEISFL